MASAVHPTRRAAPRAQVELPIVLERPKRHGRPVSARTLDLCAAGARVVADRPLRVDEVLRFELVCADGAPVAGEARVLREHAGCTYALRFERVERGTADLERAARPAT